MKTIFAKTRHVYDSYLDYFRLVEAAGYATCYIDEIDLTEPITYVTTPWNGETVPAVRGARAWGNAGKVVWHLLERDLADGNAIDPVMLDLFDAIWVSDRSYADLHPKFHHVILGGHAMFGDPCVGKHYDVCTLAYLWGRRQVVVDELVRRGKKIAPEAFGRSQQDRFVAPSRLMLNMHQYATAQIIAPIRFAVAASYNLPLITETVRDPYPLVEGRDFLMGPIDVLPSLVSAMLLTEDLLPQFATNLRSRLVLEHPFNRGVDEAVELLWRQATAS